MDVDRAWKERLRSLNVDDALRARAQARRQLVENGLHMAQLLTAGMDGRR